MRLSLYILFAIFLLSAERADANGVLRNGNSAEAMATGGTDTASADTPVDALAGNPAGLGLIDNEGFQISVASAILDAEFVNASNPASVDSASPANLVPDLAYAGRFGRLAFGLGLNPMALAETDWRFLDAPGGSTGNISYGLSKQRSKFVAVRGSAAVAVEVAPRLHAGASFGVIYNENTLQAPYIFQSQPVLRGTKVLLDMKTDGIGYNATFGLLWQPADDWNVGLRYSLPATIDSEGTASGDASLETAGAVRGFGYDAEVEVELPAIASLGLSWQARRDLELRGQLDWINWSDAFDELPVRLSNGTNATLNTVVGADSLTDIVPLGWEDRLVIRLGAAYRWSDRTTFRAGYSYGKSPVPGTLLTPLNAAILEHTVGLGIGRRIGDYQVDFAYQWDLPVKQGVGRSALRAGEFSNSETEVGIHWLALSISLTSPFR